MNVIAQLSNSEIKANIDPDILLESVKGEVFEAMKELHGMFDFINLVNR